ncbi:MAG: hypothetical protein AABX11_04750 [Nanoarchaeota archaeon]
MNSVSKFGLYGLLFIAIPYFSVKGIVKANKEAYSQGTQMGKVVEILGTFNEINTLRKDSLLGTVEELRRTEPNFTLTNRAELLTNKTELDSKLQDVFNSSDSRTRHLFRAFFAHGKDWAYEDTINRLGTNLAKTNY